MNKNLKILLSASILLHVGMNFLAPIYALYIKGIGGTLFLAGATVGFYAILKGILFLVFDRIRNKRFTEKQMIITGYGMFALSYFLYLFADRPLHVFGIQAILAIAEAVITPSWSSVIACSLDKGKETENYSYFYSIRSFFEGGGAIIGGFFAWTMGFTIVFSLMGIFATLAAFISFFLDIEGCKPKKKK